MGTCRRHTSSIVEYHLFEMGIGGECIESSREVQMVADNFEVPSGALRLAWLANGHWVWRRMGDACSCRRRPSWHGGFAGDGGLLDWPTTAMLVNMVALIPFVSYPRAVCHHECQNELL
jgi:hypothetical protein